MASASDPHSAELVSHTQSVYEKNRKNIPNSVICVQDTRRKRYSVEKADPSPARGGRKRIVCVAEIRLAPGCSLARKSGSSVLPSGEQGEEGA